ncbi:hypothetical protein BDY21DRAFT_373544 [Lineolata rhizophorae]|uniref:Uncharacterized protein n=1 Tax=Lineolata rhizophorae TaxID=578093 RepID=A0A6A6NTF0_9PEZI|nr:hypothetical protein BDY21DRAFT_373544 [Lineolata rhizophorae]
MANENDESSFQFTGPSVKMRRHAADFSKNTGKACMQEEQNPSTTNSLSLTHFNSWKRRFLAKFNKVFAEIWVDVDALQGRCGALEKENSALHQRLVEVERKMNNIQMKGDLEAVRAVCENTSMEACTN